MSKTLRIYDPAMCCSTGVCGPSVDPNILRAARDVAWLKAQGVDVERYNLAQQPQAYIENPLVAKEIAGGMEVLPLTFVDGEIVGRGAYVSRADLCRHLGLPEPMEAMGLKVVGS